MNTKTESKSTVAQRIKLIAGIIVFALLMAERSNLEEWWMRAMIAGCAFGILGWAIIQFRKKQD